MFKGSGCPIEKGEKRKEKNAQRIKDRCLCSLTTAETDKTGG